MPRGALRHALEMRKMPAADAETKALLAISMAMEMGWAALEPFLFAVAEVDDADEQDKVRTIAREYRRRLAQGAFDGQP